jgi:HTH-type transcriptional regulator/antitoxin MqsA
MAPACAEALLDMNESERYGLLVRKSNKQVNTSIVDPEFIVSVRKKPQLEQREAGRGFRGRRQCILAGTRPAKPNRHWQW